MINRKRNGGFGNIYTVCTTEEGKRYDLCATNSDAYKSIPNKKLIGSSHIYYVDGVRQESKELNYFWTY